MFQECSVIPAEAATRRPGMTAFFFTPDDGYR